MTEIYDVNKDEYLKQARQLVETLEAGNDSEANKLLETLASTRDKSLFQEIGKLTRELHDALTNIQVDTRVAQITETEIPDAKARLNHVISMTEQAAHKTLNAVEETLPLSEQLERRSIVLKKQWDRFRNRNMKVEEFRGLSKEIDEFLDWTANNATLIHKGLSDVMLAQDFQDLTGQIIRRVINMVQEVEQHLVGLIKVSGSRVCSSPAPVNVEAERIKAEGPQLPNNNRTDVCNGQDDVDALLSSLGF